MIHIVMKSALLLAGCPNTQRNQNKGTGDAAKLLSVWLTNITFIHLSYPSSGKQTNGYWILIDVYGFRMGWVLLQIVVTFLLLHAGLKSACSSPLKDDSSLKRFWNICDVLAILVLIFCLGLLRWSVTRCRCPCSLIGRKSILNIRDNKRLWDSCIAWRCLVSHYWEI